MCMLVQCTLCKRGQSEDRLIPVQVWTLTYCLRAYLCYVYVSLFYFVLFVCVSAYSLLCAFIALSLFVYLTICYRNAVSWISSSMWEASNQSAVCN